MSRFSRQRRLSLAGLLCATLLALGVALWKTRTPAPDAPTSTPPPDTATTSTPPFSTSASLIERERDYVGASSCEPCHEEQHQSWRLTFHSTMTQLPSETTVLGRFDGRPVTVFGASATPFSREGRFFFRLPALNGAPPREAEVALTVGSRRYQQYFERRENPAEGVTYRRLPLLWHVEEQRFLHLNGVFLEPDNNDWAAHNAVWNANCVFCHNTGVVPGLSDRKQFDTALSDLGIACEACHGPGREHASHYQALAKTAASASPAATAESPMPTSASPAAAGESPAPTFAGDLVNPNDLKQRESAALCGQCHSQRLPNPHERLWEYLSIGPSFRPGNLLEDHVSPVTRETPSLDPHSPRLFSDRFWNDGTARLTAYEYLSLTQSPCFRGGEYACSSCHTMHSGDPRGQLEAPMRGNAACTQCHSAFATNVSTHSHHAADSSGSQCMECHMPKMVYGVLGIHPSHRVELPSTRRDVEAARPNACALCHLDQSAQWIAERSRKFWGEGQSIPQTGLRGVPLDAPLALVALHSGDPVERATYVAALGRADSALSETQRVLALGNAIITFGDAYGAVRYLARQSALALDETLSFGLQGELRGFDVQGEPAARHQQLLALLESFAQRARGRFPTPASGFFFNPDFSVEFTRLRPLLGLQTRNIIAVGE